MASLFNEEHKLDMTGAQVLYYPDFIAPEEQQELYEQILDQTSWQHDAIKVFGKSYLQPRLTALYATHHNSYSYSSITMYPQPFSPLLEKLKTRVEEQCKHRFNSCLLNLYRDGQDSNGWHADDEKELGKNPAIASISLGAGRYFKFRNKKNKKDTRKIMLHPGSMLLMAGETQHHYQHQLPKTAKDIKARINLTFRKIIDNQNS